MENSSLFKRKMQRMIQYWILVGLENIKSQRERKNYSQIDVKKLRFKRSL